MLEKYLKMLFSFKFKKNINVLLIILVLLILALLFFGNFNLVEGFKCPTNTSNNVPLVRHETISNINNSLNSTNCNMVGQ